MSKKYETFDDWFKEIENYGTREERFLDEFGQHEGRARMIEWLQAAWKCALEERENSIWTHWCRELHEQRYTWLDRCQQCGMHRDDGQKC